MYCREDEGYLYVDIMFINRLHEKIVGDCNFHGEVIPDANTDFNVYSFMVNYFISRIRLQIRIAFPDMFGNLTIANMKN